MKYKIVKIIIYILLFDLFVCPFFLNKFSFTFTLFSIPLLWILFFTVDLYFISNLNIVINGRVIFVTEFRDPALVG